MGGNLCKELGITSTRPISRVEFKTMWTVYEDDNHHLKNEAALQFLQDFALSAGIPFDEEKAKLLVNDADIQGNGFLNYDEFMRFFYAAAKEGSVSLTVSLEGLLETDMDPDVVPKKNSLEECWQHVYEGLVKLFEQGSNFAAGDFMKLYTATYNYCSTAPDVDGLYHKLAIFLASRCTLLQRVVRKNSDVDIIEQYLRQWKIWEVASHKVLHVLKNFDKQLEKHPVHLPILDLCWLQWGTFFMKPLQEPLLEAIKKLVEKTDEKSDETVKEVLQSCVTLGLNPLIVMKDFPLKRYMSEIPPEFNIEVDDEHEKEVSRDDLDKDPVGDATN